MWVSQNGEPPVVTVFQYEVMVQRLRKPKIGILPTTNGSFTCAKWGRNKKTSGLAVHKKHKKLSSNIEAIILKMVIFTRQVLFTRGSLAFYPLVHDFRRSSSVSGSMAKGKPARKRLVRFVEDKTSFESGWWFGTCFSFFPIHWESYHPN